MVPGWIGAAFNIGWLLVVIELLWRTINREDRRCHGHRSGSGRRHLPGGMCSQDRLLTHHYQ